MLTHLQAVHLVGGLEVVGGLREALHTDEPVALLARRRAAAADVRVVVSDDHAALVRGPIAAEGASYLSVGGGDLGQKVQSMVTYDGLLTKDHVTQCTPIPTFHALVAFRAVHRLLGTCLINCVLRNEWRLISVFGKINQKSLLT